MNFLDLFKSTKTAQFSQTETDLLLRAFKSMHPNKFDSLFRKSSDFTAYKKYNYNDKKEMQQATYKQLIDLFLKNNNDLYYLIKNSEELYKRFKTDQPNNKVLQSIGAFTTIQYNLIKNDYTIQIHQDIIYPAVLCHETSEQTSNWYKELLGPLVEYSQVSSKN